MVMTSHARCARAIDAKSRQLAERDHHVGTDEGHHGRRRGGVAGQCGREGAPTRTGNERGRTEDKNADRHQQS
jgi:hypothetical protein